MTSSLHRAPTTQLSWPGGTSNTSSGPSSILVCDHGYSSSLAAATHRQLGVKNATDIDGGFQAWTVAGLPISRHATTNG